MLIPPWREQPNDSVMFPFCLPPRVPLALLDPPWSNSLLLGSWVVRRILVHWAIVSLISVPCWARSAATVRRILVMSPEFSHHQHRAVLVFARAQMCGHLPLIHSIKCSSKKSVGYMGIFLAGSLFSPLMLLLSVGRYDLVHDDLRPHGDLDSLQSKEVLVGWSSINVNFYINPTISVIYGKQ